MGEGRGRLKFGYTCVIQTQPAKLGYTCVSVLKIKPDRPNPIARPRSPLCFPGTSASMVYFIPKKVQKKTHFTLYKMPPRGRTTDNISQIASPYITQQIWEMSRALEKSIDCPVCLESVMTCRHCFCILNCGHSLHTSCYLQLRGNQCPLCRGE